VALGGLGAIGRVPEGVRADLGWTAYQLFRRAVLPNFPATRDALEDLLADLRDGSELSTREGAYKRSFTPRGPTGDHKATIPDDAAAQAQLRKQLEKLRD